MNSLEKLMSLVKVSEGGCWLWTGYKDESGYGRSSYKGKTEGVHRMFYRIHVGEIPPGMDIDHTCFVRECCNPEHLRPLPARLNRSMQRSALKDHCKNGHPFSGSNLMIRASSGRRECRQCNLEAVRRYVHRKKAASEFQSQMREYAR